MPGTEPALPPTEGNTARKAEPGPERPKLRPSGQLGNARGNWNLPDPVPAMAPTPDTGESQRPAMLRPAPGGQTPGAPDQAQEGIAAPPRRHRQEPHPDLTKGNPQAEATKIRLHELLIEELEHGALEGSTNDNSARRWCGRRGS